MLARVLQVTGTELLLAGLAAWVVDAARHVGISFEQILMFAVLLLVLAVVGRTNS